MTTPPAHKLSILAIGAHLDDCWLGMGGVALKAARRGHRVTMVQAVSTYGAWPVVAGRGAEIKPRLQKIADDAGVKLVTLGYDYMRLEQNPALIERLTREVAQAEADILFCHWEDDSNQDHAALGTASRVAAMHAPCFLSPDATVKLPRQILYYPTDSQTKNFLPDTFVDIGDVLFDLLELCAGLDELYAKSPRMSNVLRRATVTDHQAQDRTVALTMHTEEKYASSIVNGRHCGARYAEGFRSYRHCPVGSEPLAQL